MMTDDNKEMLDSETSHAAIQLIRDRTGDDVHITIMHLLLCLRIVSDANDISPKQASEDFRQLFLSIEGHATSDSVN